MATLKVRTDSGCYEEASSQQLPGQPDQPVQHMQHHPPPAPQFENTQHNQPAGRSGQTFQGHHEQRHGPASHTTPASQSSTRSNPVNAIRQQQGFEHHMQHPNQATASFNAPNVGPQYFNFNQLNIGLYEEATQETQDAIRFFLANGNREVHGFHNEHHGRVEETMLPPTYNNTMAQARTHPSRGTVSVPGHGSAVPGQTTTVQASQPPRTQAPLNMPPGFMSSCDRSPVLKPEQDTNQVSTHDAQPASMQDPTDPLDADNPLLADAINTAVSDALKLSGQSSQLSVNDTSNDLRRAATTATNDATMSRIGTFEPPHGRQSGLPGMLQDYRTIVQSWPAGDQAQVISQIQQSFVSISPMPAAGTHGTFGQDAPISSDGLLSPPQHQPQHWLGHSMPSPRGPTGHQQPNATTLSQAQYQTHIAPTATSYQAAPQVAVGVTNPRFVERPRFDANRHHCLALLHEVNVLLCEGHGSSEDVQNLSRKLATWRNGVRKSSPKRPRSDEADAQLQDRAPKRAAKRPNKRRRGGLSEFASEPEQLVDPAATCAVPPKQPVEPEIAPAPTMNHFIQATTSHAPASQSQPGHAQQIMPLVISDDASSGSSPQLFMTPESPKLSAEFLNELLDFSQCSDSQESAPEEGPSSLNQQASHDLSTTRTHGRMTTMRQDLTHDEPHDTIMKVSRQIHALDNDTMMHDANTQQEEILKFQQYNFASYDASAA